jgi:Mg-chelatase subunit ChlD
MRTIRLTTLVLFFCMLQTVWADDHDTFSVKGPVNAQHLSFQQIEEGKLLVSVTDEAQKPIMGLMPKDFSILKGNKPVKVTSVEPLETSKDIGLNIVLVVDNSGSMKNRDAVQPLLKALEAFYQMIRPIDKIVMVVFDDYKTVDVDGRKLHAKVLRSDDVDQLREMVRDQMTEGLTAGTYLYDAMRFGLDLARQWPEKSNKFMVVLTDGEDVNSLVKASEVSAAAKTIPNFGAFAVDYKSGKTLDKFLQAFAGENNGQIRKASTAEELIPIFKEFSSTLLHRYIVSYRDFIAPAGTLSFEPAQVTI